MCIRDSVAQCYEAIIKDLKEGADLLDEEFNKGDVYKRQVWLRESAAGKPPALQDGR